MNDSHAFADAPVAPKLSLIVKAALCVVGPFHPKYGLWLRCVRAWDSFGSRATLSAQVRLGPNARCVNLAGDRTRIVLEGRVICRGVLRLENVENSRIVIHPEVYIGDNCLLSCSNHIEIGAHTLLAHSVEVFDNNSHPVDWQARAADWQARMAGDGETKGSVPNAPVRIGEHCWIGAHTLIFKGVTIGDKSVIAAGSVVTHDIPAGVLAGGNPARIIRTL